MTKDRCPTCGSLKTRIDAPMSIQGVTVPDSYCGHCGVKWGSVVKTVQEQLEGRRHAVKLKAMDGLRTFVQRLGKP